jgi:hypothetical protein
MITDSFQLARVIRRKFIPNDMKEKALKAINRMHKTGKLNREADLPNAFDWSQTKEGASFWATIDAAPTVYDVS